MNSRERMLAAIDRRPVDRLPTDIWATPEVWNNLRAHFGEGVDLYDALHLDGFGSTAPDYIGPELTPAGPDETIDIWGLRRKPIAHAGGTYHEQYYFPLAEARTNDELNRYQWPTTDWFDYSGMRDQAAVSREKRAVQCGYMAPFYYHNLLRGLEQSLIDPLDDPDFSHEIVNRISDFFYAHHRRMFEACDGLIDIAQVTDDLGSQTGPLIGMEVYTEFYAPHHKRFIDLCHEFGIRVFHHDDGDCREFIPLLVEMGIDILNPIQWRCGAMDMAELKQTFGGQICFHGAIDNQETMPFGTPDDVRALVRRCIDLLASDGTGYVVAPCHNLQGITPVENILALYDEAHTYGERACRPTAV